MVRGRPSAEQFVYSWSMKRKNEKWKTQLRITLHRPSVDAIGLLDLQYSTAFSQLFFSKIWLISICWKVSNWFALDFQKTEPTKQNLLMCTSFLLYFCPKNKNNRSLSKWKISRCFLLQSWKTNLWKWRYAISPKDKINCFVIAPHRPVCI